jgi:3-oxoacyl-[acyl-carrier-protein] synthase II
MGVFSPVAHGREAYWKALCEGRTGFRPITLFDSAPFGVSIAGEIADFDPLALLGKKGLRDLDRSTRLVCSAAMLALQDSNLEITPENTSSIGVSIGATYGSLHSISQFDRTGLLEGPRAVNPSHFPNTVLNSPASQISIRFKIKGFNTTISSGFCASLDAVSYAADFIRLNRAAVVLSGGVEELCEETFMAFHHLGFLSGSNGSAPACRPFDAKRNGMILSEGSAILILENEEHASDRGAKALGRILGYGNSFDPRADASYAEAGAGLRSAIHLALQEASLRPEDIGCVCASANATRGLDLMETRIIKQVFGDRASAVPVTAIKSMIGETFSASGSLALAAAVGVLQTGSIPPTAGYLQKDPACDLDYVIDGCRSERIENILVTGADPYGANCAVILGR